MEDKDCGCVYGGIIIAPNGDRECCKKPEGDEAKTLAKVAERAWSDPNYRNKLLTFDERETIDWSAYKSDPAKRNKMLNDTRDAMKDEGYQPSGGEIPVVLSNSQFERGIYWKQDTNERVFRLPDAPTFWMNSLIKNDQPLKLAISLYEIKTNICGM